MGASSSADHGEIEQHRRQEEEEASAASTGFLPVLRSSFPNLSPPGSSTLPLSSLQAALSLDAPTLTSESTPVPDHFHLILANLGKTLASLIFPKGDDGEIDWIGFLIGYNRCCARMPVSQSVNLLYRLYAALCREASAPCGLEFDPDSDENDKVGGSLLPGELLVLLWICWVMGHSSRIAKMPKGGKDPLVLPDVSHLLLSAFVSCGVVTEDESIWRCDVAGIDKGVSAQKLQTWVLTTVPGLSNCLARHVQERIRDFSTSAESVSSSDLVSDDNSNGDVHDAYLLTRGRAWAVSLTQREKLSEELSSFQVNSWDLLYRSSIHGKGLSRFWSNVEGYNSSLFVLVSASSEDSTEHNNPRRWIIGISTAQGFENKDSFFGSSGNLYAINPIFRVFPPSGKEKNFLYCHLRPTIRVYEPNPKPVGLAFGGSIGNERIFIDEDFAQVTVRHHAIDKTYQHGSLIPNQGFLPVEASVLEVEVWGFGGKAAKEKQDAFKNRENLFSEQRRKIDLKTFANWEDSPEKMMMEMVSDPNKVRREDR
ncbi:uncharacterized protein LOC122054949 [Zingiber officinale]|uniref:uncharacterized protein LOC122054949 n=1 Tax=Zingiber officinale TaxID=94328 RepID=UPI001C4BCF59|nr:uncharacterized protein LOC122054949 [Zingiber officinale]